MLILFIVSVLGWPLAAYCAYEWWKADMDVSILELRCDELMRLNKQARDALKPTRPPPAAGHWGKRPYDRLVADMGLHPLPDSPRLSIVPSDSEAGREAHSHAEKGAS